MQKKRKDISKDVQIIESTKRRKRSCLYRQSKKMNTLFQRRTQRCFKNQNNKGIKSSINMLMVITMVILHQIGIILKPRRRYLMIKGNVLQINYGVKKHSGVKSNKNNWIVHGIVLSIVKRIILNLLINKRLSILLAEDLEKIKQRWMQWF